MKRESFLKRFLTLYLPLIVILLFILFPFYWTFITSIKPDTELYGAVTYWPRHVQWENYSKLFTTTVNFLAAMKNSFIVAGVTTIVSLTASTLASYAFSRYRFAGRRAMMALFLSNNMFPTVLLLIPLYSIMRNLGLLYTPWALVLAYTTFTLPFSVWLLNGFFNDLPLSLEEAALVDGCNRRMAFLQDHFTYIRSLPCCHRSIYFHDIMERVYICGNVYEQCDKNNTCSTEEFDRSAWC